MLLLLLVLMSWMGGGYADRFLKKDDVPRVMAELFAYHIESKDLTAAVVRRCFKVYIEQFDPEKNYLLQTEVQPFLSMTDEKAKAIAARIRQGDFSDFYALNSMIQKAILRSQQQRKLLENAFEEIKGEQLEALSTTQYAASENELLMRQKSRVVRFFQYHHKKHPIANSEQKAKFFSLLERKLKRQENPYLFRDSQGNAMDAVQSDHYMSLRILKSFAKSLDAHTSFFSEEEALEMRMNLEKQFEGLGVVLSEGIDGILIAEIMPGSPAFRSGQIQVNDLLVEIDGVSLKGAPFELALDLLKKRDRAEHVLGVERGSVAGKRTFLRVELKKAPIVMDQDRLTYSFEPHGKGIIGKITMNSFYENGEGITSERDIKIALQKLQEHGPLVGLILDLRENAGGFLSQAVKVTGLFISSGVVVVSKYSQGKIHYLRSLDPKVHYNGPLIVLTSKLSASAAEIVAQSLQDYGAALVVGDERTFGKGSIQYQTVTDERAEYFYKVTVGKYYTVSGKTTQIEGVHADIVVPTHFAPFPLGERYLEYPLSSDRIPAAYSDHLTDLEGGVKLWFQKNYLPFLQKKITFWRKMIPALKEKSAARIAESPRFQKFLATQEKVKANLSSREIPWDELKSLAEQDLQMEEASYIMKDMIFIEAESKAASEQTYLNCG